MNTLWGWFLCRVWFRKHRQGRPLFRLPESEPGNAEINSQLRVMECPRCKATWTRKAKPKGGA